MYSRTLNDNIDYYSHWPLESCASLASNKRGWREGAIGIAINLPLSKIYANMIKHAWSENWDISYEIINAVVESILRRTTLKSIEKSFEGCMKEFTCSFLRDLEVFWRLENES